MPAFDYQQAVEALGGIAALRLMVNARDFVKGDDYLQFRFSGNRGANVAKVSLNGQDLYEVRLYFQRGAASRIVAKGLDVYAEDLRREFEVLSGLSLSVPRIKGVNA